MRITLRIESGITGDAVLSHMFKPVKDDWLHKLRQIDILAYLGINPSELTHLATLQDALGIKQLNFNERFVSLEDGQRVLRASVSGSTLKGLLRGLYDRLVLTNVIEARTRELTKVAHTSELVDIPEHLLTRLCHDTELLKECLGCGRGVRRVGGEEQALAMLRILAMSPLTCGTITPCADARLGSLNCEVPVSTRVLKLRLEANKVLSSMGVKSFCIRVEGEDVHCLPISRLCVGCALFGCAGLQSILRFKRAFIEVPNATDRAVVKLHSTWLGRRDYGLELLGFGCEAVFTGDVVIETCSDRMNVIHSLSYLQLLQKERIYLAGDIHPHLSRLIEILEEISNAFSKLQHDLIVEGYIRLFNLLADYGRGSNLGLAFGLRKRVGFGVLKDMSIKVLDQ